MPLKFTKSEIDFALIHGIFVVLCIVILLIPIPHGLGLNLFILVTSYNILIPVFGKIRGHDQWVPLWLFSFVLSLFQIFPDWFLSAELNILVFPEDGLFKIGTVSGYMLGLWAIPFFMILFIGHRIQEHYSTKTVYITITLLTLIIFSTSENTIWMLNSWYAQNVLMIDHIAVYIVIPEIILGIFTFYGYSLIKMKPHWQKIPVAFVIMLLYLGSATFFYFLIESL